MDKKTDNIPRDLTPQEIKQLLQSKKEIAERVKELWNNERAHSALLDIPIQNYSTCYDENGIEIK